MWERTQALVRKSEKGGAGGWDQMHCYNEVVQGEDVFVQLGNSCH